MLSSNHFKGFDLEIFAHRLLQGEIMKKLIFNENTNMIYIIDQEDLNEAEKKKINCIKEKLENNKIYFEVFSYVIIGIMGIVIALVGNNINQKTMEIYEKQLQILDNENY